MDKVISTVSFLEIKTMLDGLRKACGAYKVSISMHDGYDSMLIIEIIPDISSTQSMYYALDDVEMKYSKPQSILFKRIVDLYHAGRWKVLDDRSS
jgi:hypothetical protein